MTPVLHWTVPSVMHMDSEIAFMIDPKSAQNMKQDDELPFVHVKVDGNFVNFEEWVDEDSWIPTWTINPVIGQIGET